MKSPVAEEEKRPAAGRADAMERGEAAAPTRRGDESSPVLLYLRTGREPRKVKADGSRG